jgi:hypothetical protein
MSGESDRDGEPAREEPEGWGDVDVDAAFAAIVAQFSQADPQVGPWPAAEDLDRPVPGGAAPAAGDPTGRPGTDDPPRPADRNPPAPGDPAGRAAGLPSEEPGPDTPGGPGSTHSRGPEGPAGGPRAHSLRRAGWGGTRPDRTGGRHALDPGGASGTGEPGDSDRLGGSSRPGDGSGPGDGNRPADGGEDPDEEDRFVPPEPAPIGRADPVTTLAWVCVIGGPLFLLLAALAWRTLPGWLLLSALVAFVGGFVLLVARMPGEPPDDPDNGAVV